MVSDDDLSEAETAKRRDDALKRALSTPPMPKKSEKAESKKTKPKRP